MRMLSTGPRCYCQPEGLKRRDTPAPGKLDGKTQRVLGEMWQEVCERGRDLNFKIVSGSMSPMINTGNVVTVSKADPSRVRIGDVLAFQDGENIVVHRVIGKCWINRQLYFRHRGDAGVGSGRVPAINLIGRVLSVRKDGREIMLGTSWYVIINKILGWRLRFRDRLDGVKPRYFSIVLHQAMRPIWRICRSLLLWRI